MHSYHSSWLRLSLFFTLLSQPIQSLRIRNEWTKPGYVRSPSYDQVECLGEVMQSKIYPRFFANSFGTLDHFKVDCKAEELVSGQNPPGQNPPGQNPPDKIPLDKIPPRTKSPQDKIPLDKIPPVYFIFYWQ